MFQDRPYPCICRILKRQGWIRTVVHVYRRIEIDRYKTQYFWLRVCRRIHRHPRIYIFNSVIYQLISTGALPLLHPARHMSAGGSGIFDHRITDGTSPRAATPRAVLGQCGTARRRRKRACGSCGNRAKRMRDRIGPSEQPDPPQENSVRKASAASTGPWHLADFQLPGTISRLPGPPLGPAETRCLPETTLRTPDSP